MSKILDEQLIIDYLAGDEKSLEVLIKRYLKPIYSFVYRYVGNSQEAEDITQETFVKVWKNLKKPAPYRIYSGAGFNPKKGNFKTWVFEIAKNTSIDWLRKSGSALGGKKTIPFSRFENEKGQNTLIEKLISPSIKLAEAIDNKKLLVAATEGLSIEDKRILNLRHKDNLNFREIAELLEESINTVKSRYRRALIILKRKLGNNDLVH